MMDDANVFDRIFNVTLELFPMFNINSLMTMIVILGNFVFNPLNLSGYIQKDGTCQHQQVKMLIFRQLQYSLPLPSFLN